MEYISVRVSDIIRQVNRDIYLPAIGLRGSYRYFYYRWRNTRLYLNLLKPPAPNEANPEELTYGFAFRESAEPDDDKPQLPSSAVCEPILGFAGIWWLEETGA